MKCKHVLLCLALGAALMFSTAFAVPFQLRNSSLRSIPLRIPGVMNPNLSPLSNSSVDLAPGQEIFFYQGKKRYLLLVVDDSLAGQVLNVAKLIRLRKKELGLGQNHSGILPTGE